MDADSMKMLLGISTQPKSTVNPWLAWRVDCPDTKRCKKLADAEKSKKTKRCTTTRSELQTHESSAPEVAVRVIVAEEGQQKQLVDCTKEQMVEYPSFPVEETHPSIPLGVEELKMAAFGAVSGYGGRNHEEMKNVVKSAVRMQKLFRVRFNSNEADTNRKGGDGCAETENRFDATFNDTVGKGTNEELNMGNIRAPTVGGIGSMKLNAHTCVFMCEGCEGSKGFDIQTIADLHRQTICAHKAKYPNQQEKTHLEAGAIAVHKIVGLIMNGKQKEAIAARVTCKNAFCMIAAGTMLVKDRMKWIKGKQAPNLSIGNRRHGSKEVFMCNVRLLRKMFVEKDMNEEEVAVALMDISQTTFWVENREREFIGVANALAKRSEDMGYPLTGVDAKHSFIARMKSVPSNFVNTVLLMHIKDRSFPDNIHTKCRSKRKAWDTVFSDHLKQTFCDALTTAFADMVHQNWIQNGEPIDSDGMPIHMIHSSRSSIEATLMDSAVGFHTVVEKYLASAHDYKSKHFFDYMADDVGSNVHDAIKATTKGTSGMCIGMQAEFMRIVTKNSDGGQSTTSMVPSAGKTVIAMYAPACNTIRQCQNCPALERHISALLCLGVKSASRFVLCYLTKHKRDDRTNGYKIMPPTRVADARRMCSIRASQRQSIFDRNQKYDVTLGASKKRGIAATANSVSYLGKPSLVGLPIHNPTVTQVESSSLAPMIMGLGGESETKIRRVLASSATLTNGVCRETPLEQTDTTAINNVKARFQKLVDDQVVDPEQFTLANYMLCDTDHFWNVAEIAKKYEQKRWWGLTQMKPGRWRCKKLSCRDEHRVWSPHMGDRTCKCTKRNCSFAKYLDLMRIDPLLLWPSRENELDRFCRKIIINSQHNVDRHRFIANHTTDDTAKIAAWRVKLAEATVQNDTKNVKKYTNDLKKSRGLYSQQKHSRVLVIHKHQLPRTISRFRRGVVDVQTTKLKIIFDREIKRMTGSGAQRRVRLGAHRSGRDDSVYSGRNYLAAEVNAEVGEFLEPSTKPRDEEDAVSNHYGYQEESEGELEEEDGMPVAPRSSEDMQLYEKRDDPFLTQSRHTIEIKRHKYRRHCDMPLSNDKINALVADMNPVTLKQPKIRHG